MRAAEPSASYATDPAPVYGRACTACRHRSRVGTCIEPVAAGLAEHHAIRWPGPLHAATCPAFNERRPPCSKP